MILSSKMKQLKFKKKISIFFFVIVVVVKQFDE